jgi:hypothetical protein
MRTTIELYRNLVAAMLEPGLDDVSRASRAREVGDAASDLREGVRIAQAVLPSLVVPAARLGDVGDGRAADNALGQVLAQRHLFAELRAVAYETLTDVPGLKMQGTAADVRDGGLGGGLPIIRTYATEWSTSGGKSPVVPGLIEGGDDDGVIDPEPDDMTDGDPFTIADVGEEEEWHYSVAASLVSRQLIDFTTDEARRELDQLMFDIADRGAEKHIGARLVADAGGSTAAGTNLVGFDTAEGLASAALKAPADLVIVNPADWSKVRRAVAQSWQQGPAPVPAVSIGVEAGTAIVTGRGAFHLLRRDYDVAFKAEPKVLGNLTGIGRWFYLAIRNPAAIRKVTGI